MRRIHICASLTHLYGVHVLCVSSTEYRDWVESCPRNEYSSLTALMAYYFSRFQLNDILVSSAIYSVSYDSWCPLNIHNTNLSGLLDSEIPGNGSSGGVRFGIGLETSQALRCVSLTFESCLLSVDKEDSYRS
eukprot:scaffold31138_cov58-Attheya_sp.AAC.3